MPTYEFLCDTCGPFEQRRSLNEAGDPMACPSCQTVAQRIYSTSGFIFTAGAALRRRIESGVQPTVVKRAPSEEPSPQKLQQSVHSRPWQLGHAAQTAPANPGLQRL